MKMRGFCNIRGELLAFYMVYAQSVEAEGKPAAAKKTTFRLAQGRALR